MAQGSGSAKLTLLLVVGILCMLALTKPTLGGSYTVGDDVGWGFNVEDWADGKPFKAGDVLEFKYDKTAHNVVVVDKENYDSCSEPSGAKVYQSGRDEITLDQGQSYFICSFPGHCEAGMKIAVNAA